MNHRQRQKLNHLARQTDGNDELGKEDQNRKVKKKKERIGRKEICGELI